MEGLGHPGTLEDKFANEALRVHFFLRTSDDGILSSRFATLADDVCAEGTRISARDAIRATFVSVASAP